MRRLAYIALVLASTVHLCAASDFCLPSTVTDAKLTVAIQDGRTSFRAGEIIPLVMSFTSATDKRYWVEDRNYDRSGRLNMENYCVEPAARDPLLDYFRGGVFMGGGLGGEQQLSQNPFTATAQLNEWRELEPGHYRLYVVSHRVWRPSDPTDSTHYDRVPVTLRSNLIEFDVKADPDWNLKQVWETTATYQSATGQRQNEAARRLRFLNTKESADALVRLFWGLNDQPGGWDLMFGLFGSPHRTEVIKGMQHEIVSPEHPITPDFLSALTELQIDADPAWDPLANDPVHPNVDRQSWPKRQAHHRDLLQAAVAATVVALPQKIGRARAVTVQTLAQSSEFLDPRTASQMRKQLAAVWSDLPERIKRDLIQYQWSQIAGPEMLPILEEFVSGPAPPFRTEEAMTRDAALKHIFDLDPDSGRSLILRDLRDRKAQPSITLVKLLPADELQPSVKEAVVRIENNDARELDYHLLELFADRSTLNGIERVFNEHLGQWACDPQSAMLRYFLRMDPEFGKNAVQRSLAARKETGCYRMLFQDLEKSLPKVEPVAISALDDKDLEVANDAARALGRWGTAKAEPALWGRLKRFHEEWKSREGELRPTPDYGGPVARAMTLESTLANSIATGTNWICNRKKLERLRALVSPRQQMQVASWSSQWMPDASIVASWYPEDRMTFAVLQYSNLDEEQFRAKLSQMPAGTKFYFQIWKPGEIFPPVTVEKQQAVLHALAKYAARFGVIIEARSTQ